MNMLAWTVLAAFAAIWMAYEIQNAFGRHYERRTMRLRQTQEEFYEAAHTMLTNPALDLRHLRFVRTAARHVAEGGRARMHLSALRQAARKENADEVVDDTPVGLEEDLVRVVRAVIYAVAERQPLWKGALLRAYHQGAEAPNASPERNASAVERALDHCLPTAA